MARTLSGLRDISRYAGFPKREDARQICPTATCIIGVAFRIPKGIVRNLKNSTQAYTYTSLGIKAIAEEKTTVFLMRMARIIEDEGL